MNTAILIRKLEIAKAGLDLIEKVSRRQAMRAHHIRLRRQTQKMKSPTRRFLAYMRDEILKKIPASGRGMAQKGWIDNLVDWEEIRIKGIEIFKPELLRTMTVGGESVFRTRIRKQERFDPIGVEAVGWVNRNGADLVVAISETTIVAIRAAIKTGVNAGLSMPKLASQIRPLVGLIESHALAVQKLATKLAADGAPADAITKAVNRYARKLHTWRVNTIARTESGEALLRGQILGYKQMGVKKAQRVEDPECCDLCSELDGKILPLEEAESIGLLHPNCITGNMRVIAPGIKRAYSAGYDGPIIRIEMMGSIITVTPNHALLTSKGFVRASSLRKGDKILYCPLFEREMFSHPDNNGKPPFIEDVIAALAITGGMTVRSMPVAPEYFHGDAALMNGDINIISTNGLLRRNRELESPEPLGKRGFGPPDSDQFGFSSFGTLADDLITLALSANRIVGGRRNSLPIIGGSYALPHIQPDITPGSERNPRYPEPSENRLTAAIEAFRNAIQGLSCEITTLDILSVERIFHDKPLMVFDLETSSSLYLCEGVLSSNCEGTWIPA